MADKVKVSWFKVSMNTMCNTLKEHTKYAHTVHGRPTLKDVERFRNWSVREHYERSLYERTFMSNLAILVYFNKVKTYAVGVFFLLTNLHRRHEI